MPNPVLTRFDTTILKPVSSSDPTQQAVPSALVEFFSQGATVKVGTTIQTTGTIEIYDPGEIAQDSIIQVGSLSGPLLTVTVQPNVFPFAGGARLTVRNDSGIPVVVPVNARLMLLTNRPALFSDPVGTQPLAGAYVQADPSTGRVQVYVAKTRFDYVVYEPAAVALDAASSATVVGTQLTWQHWVSGENRVLIVEVAWASIDVGEILSVKFNGIDMTLVAAPSNPICHVYTLRDPPVGLGTVTIDFTADVSAVAGAISARNTDRTVTPAGAAVKVSTTTSAPEADVPGSNPFGLVVDAVAAGSLTDSEDVVTTQTGQVRLWKALMIAPPQPRVLAAGSTRPGATIDNAPTPTMGWSIRIGSNPVVRPWSIVALPLRPVVIRVHIDAIGGTQPSPSWINARDFPTLQDAINALPSDGGTIFMPAGVYLAAPSSTSTSGLRVDRDNVVIQGEGIFNTGIIPPGPVNPNPPFNKDLVTVTGKGCRIENLSIDGNSGGPAVSCLVLEGPAVENCALQSIECKRAPLYGLLIKNITSLLATDVQAGSGQNSGVRIERTSDTPWQMTFISGAFSDNLLSGIEIDIPAAYQDKGDAIVLFGCTMEGNQAGLATRGNGLHIVNGRGITALGCYFERRSGGAPGEQFILAIGAKGISVEGCYFNGSSETLPSTAVMKQAAVFQACTHARFTNNVGYRLSDALATFDAATTHAVEFGNRDLTQDPPRITMNGSLFGLSKGAVQVFRYASLPSTTGIPLGSLVWVDAPDGHLYVCTSTGWKQVLFTP